MGRLRRDSGIPAANAPVQRAATPGFGAVEPDELGHRQAGLELDRVHGHAPALEKGHSLSFNVSNHATLDGASTPIRLSFDMVSAESRHLSAPGAAITEVCRTTL